LIAKVTTTGASVEREAGILSPVITDDDVAKKRAWTEDLPMWRDPYPTWRTS